MAQIPDHKELKAGWDNAVKVQKYSIKEVQRHKSKQDLWIILHGRVYNVSDYARDHPGGVEPLLQVAGADATSAYEDVGHSDDAGEIMQAYLIGVVEGVAGTSVKTDKQDDELRGVRIVRRPVPHDTRGNETELKPMLRTAEIGVLCIGIAGLFWAAQDLHVLQDTGGRGGFLQGFIASLSMCGVVAVVGVRYFQQASSFGPEFNKLAGRMQSSTPRITDFHPSGVLSPEYRKFKLREKTELADGIFSFVFDLPTKSSVLGLPTGQHIAVRASLDEPDHTIVRSYTPVSNNRDLGRLELLIRVYPDGKLGNYLKALSPGSAVDIRGPKGAMRYRKGMCRTMGMVAGGTGITPMYQIIRAICENEHDDTNVVLVYANRSESDILLRKKLDHYADVARHKFTVYYTLDQPPSRDWNGGKGHVTKDMLRRLMPQPASDAKVLLCGPPGMVSATKRNLVECGFEQPGSVSKMTDQIFCF